MLQEKTNAPKIGAMIGIGVILTVWAVVIYLLWDVRHYVKFLTTIHRRAYLAHDSHNTTNTNTKHDENMAEAFKDSPYKAYPMYRPAQDLKW